MYQQNKYNLSHLYNWHDRTKENKWDTRLMWLVRTSVLFNMVVNTKPEQTISKRDNTWLFQVCKHLISCILQCAIRDHLGHICCRLKHFKVEATLCRKTQRPTARRSASPCISKARIWNEHVQYITRNVYCHVWMVDNYAQPLLMWVHLSQNDIKGIHFNNSWN